VSGYFDLPAEGVPKVRIDQLVEALAHLSEQSRLRQRLVHE
jgi:hypothetical protein